MTGYIGWLRGQVGSALLPLAYATAIIRDSAGRVLFQRRADFGDAWWGLPGGLFEPGETPEACLQREVLEEAGLTVTPRRLTGVYSSLRYRVAYPNGDQVQQVTVCYECDWRAGELRPQAGEVDELRFFAPHALPPMPIWYADMLAHALEARPLAYFDPPEQAAVATPLRTVMDLRTLVGHAPLVWPCADAAVLDEAGRLLLQRRADDGEWGVPGGALDTGETLAQAAVRETREETGIEVEPAQFLAIRAGYRVQYPGGSVAYPVVATFLCRPVGGRLAFDGRESTEVGFFSRAELPPLPPRMARVAQLAFESRGL